MMKKIFALLVVVMSLTAVAQTGSWRLHPTFSGSSVQAIYDTKECVYYLASNNLFRFDKTTEENESLTKTNGLSDVVISNIYYNYDKKYLAVAYTNSNLDFILEDGRVVNMSDIKDAVLTSAKAINDITFADGLAYVATEFGYVVIDDAKWIVKESHLFNVSLSSVARVGTTLLMRYGTDTYYGDATAYRNTLSSYKKAASTGANGHFYPANETKYFLRTDAALSVCTITGEGDAATFARTQIVANKAENVQRTKTGFLANFMAKSFYYTFDAAGGSAAKVNGGAEMYSNNPDDGDIYWVVGANGLHRNGETSYYKPSSLTINNGTAGPYWINYNPDSKKIYVAQSANNFNQRQSEINSNIINCYDGNTWTDVSFLPVPGKSGGPYWINFVPGHPNIYYQAYRRAGIYKVVDDQLAATINSSASGALSPAAINLNMTSCFDRHGNLVVTSNWTNTNSCVWVLPAAKAALTTAPANSDWLTQTVPGLSLGTIQFSRMTSSPTGDFIAHAPGHWGNPVFVIDESNINASSPRYAAHSVVNDQDGNTIDWSYIYGLTFDKDGMLWVGHVAGLFYFDPEDAFHSVFNVTRPKIARNDGTSLADYLLEGSQVNCIAVDKNNHKWIGTHYSGLFEISADNSAILNQFDITNSDLPSNTIYNIACNDETNSVFVTTPNGVAEYVQTETSGGAADLSNVYVYPNPVRPEFTGLVTVSGLMDNTLVKIADSGGNVIKQLKSTGGQVTWDACDNDGERVATGVYFVLASDATGNGEKTVAKFMVIK